METHVNRNWVKIDKNRLEAFSDGVLAIINTIAVSIYVLVALMWFIPNRRIEPVLSGKDIYPALATDKPQATHR